MALKIIFKLSATAFGLTLRLAFFATVVLGFYVIYRLLLEQSLDGSQQIWPLLGLWIITAYIVVPRIHRILSKYYVPNYFVGRVRSPSGFLSDPINVAFIGKEDTLHKAMKQAGWSLADPLNLKTMARTVYATILKQSYPNAPVGNMYLFNRKHDFAYEIEVNGTPNERHHIRFWKTPNNWYLPGGHEADWLAAATYDTHVGIKVATGQIDHFIMEDIDKERDFVVSSVESSGYTKDVEIVEHFTNAYHDRNNGGDRIKTDGSLPFITLI